MIKKSSRIEVRHLPTTATTRILAAAFCAALLLGGCGGAESVESSPASTMQSTTTTTTTATTKTTKTTTTVTYAKPTAVRGKVLIDVPTIHQYPEYPTGCESVATVMALRYAGETTSVANFIDNYLECSSNFYWSEGEFYGPSPYEYFLGDPRSENSYGCMAPVIKKALIRYFGSDDRVADTTGTALSALCKSYIDNGMPVIVWASIGMSQISDGRSWILPDGTIFAWPNNEHCLLLVGYDANKYYFNDPYTGKVVGYTRSVVEQRYERLGKQSLVIK